jgi:dihydrofolate reductase
MRISIIAAVAENGIIGRGGALPWRLSDDLRRFKQLTMGHTIVMGRRTWESIGRALPGRRTVVVSRSPDFRTSVDGVETATSLDQALGIAETAGDNEAFIVGGAELYRESLGRANRLHLTRVQAAVEGDTSFPDIDWNTWQLVESEEHDASEKNEYAYRFETYDRS